MTIARPVSPKQSIPVFVMAVPSEVLRCSSPIFSIREDVGSSIGKFPPRTSSLRSFTIFPDSNSDSSSNTILEEFEQDKQQIQPYEPSEQAMLPLQYDEFLYVTWDPPQLYVPPPRFPSTQAAPAPTQHLSSSISSARSSGRCVDSDDGEHIENADDDEVESFPEYIDPANNLIIARTLLLDKLHFRATSPEHASKPLQGRPFEAVFSRIVPGTGYLREQQDLTRERSSVADILQAGEALRAQRAGGNKAKAPVSLRGSGRGASSARDPEPKDVLRHKLKRSVRQGMEMALRWEQEFAWSFLDHQSESSNAYLYGAVSGGGSGSRERRTGRSRARRAARRPPGVTREEVRVALEMLRQSLPGLYYKDDDADGAKSAATAKANLKNSDKSEKLGGGKSRHDPKMAGPRRAGGHRFQSQPRKSSFVEKRNAPNNARFSSAFEPVGIVFAGRREEPKNDSSPGRRPQRGSKMRQIKAIAKRASVTLKRVAAGFGLRQPSTAPTGKKRSVSQVPADTSEGIAFAGNSWLHQGREGEIIPAQIIEPTLRTRGRSNTLTQESVKRQGLVINDTVSVDNNVPRKQAGAGAGEKEYVSTSAPSSSSGQSSSAAGSVTASASASDLGSGSSRRSSPSPTPTSDSTSDATPVSRSSSSSPSSFASFETASVKGVSLTRPSAPARVMGTTKKPVKLQKPRKADHAKKAPGLVSEKVQRVPESESRRADTKTKSRSKSKSTRKIRGNISRLFSSKFGP